MASKTERAVRKRTATSRLDTGLPGAAAVAQPARPDTVAQDARASLRPAGPTRQANPMTRQIVLYGIAAGAVARIPLFPRFQTNVIISTIVLTLARSILKAAAKDTIVGIERYYVGIEPIHLHLRRTRRQRRRA